MQNSTKSTVTKILTIPIIPFTQLKPSRSGLASRLASVEPGLGPGIFMCMYLFIYIYIYCPSCNKDCLRVSGPDKGLKSYTHCVHFLMGVTWHTRGEHAFDLALSKLFCVQCWSTFYASVSYKEELPFEQVWWWPKIWLWATCVYSHMSWVPIELTSDHHAT